MCLSPGLLHVAVLHTQHDVGAGAAAGGLLEQTAALQRGRHAAQRAVAHAPCLTVAVDVPLTGAAGAVPHHLLWPGTKQKQENREMRFLVLLELLFIVPLHGLLLQFQNLNKSFLLSQSDDVKVLCHMICASPCAVSQNVLAIEGVDWHIVLHSAATEDGVPAVKQNLVLRKMKPQNDLK